jgi:hypothetical protein
VECGGGRDGRVDRNRIGGESARLGSWVRVVEMYVGSGYVSSITILGRCSESKQVQVQMRSKEVKGEEERRDVLFRRNFLQDPLRKAS